MADELTGYKTHLYLGLKTGYIKEYQQLQDTNSRC
jgi:hypothetical protein